MTEEALSDDIMTDDAERDAMLTVHIGDDGSVEISLPGQDDLSTHDRNLALRIEEDDLNILADDLIRLIEQDDQSRGAWLERRAREIDLLGIDPEVAPPGSSSEGMSKVRHPVLLDAVLRFQANARGELLPVDGPAKIRVDHPDDGTTLAPNGMTLDDLAEAFETDINVYLTEVATEYVPSTDKMLFGVGLSGMGFKKVFHCPLRRRPVSEAVPATDIIVSNDIEDIRNASRVTHVIKMRSATVRRMQLAGAYRDIDLVDPGYEPDNTVEERVDTANGVSEVTFSAEDRERTIYECYCELDIPGYEHKDEKGNETGLPLPYKVVIDKSDSTILEIRRNWVEGDENCLARQVIVPWVFVPWHGGFWALGLGAIMGGTTQAATAGWRILLDTGMQNAFPGGFIDKSFLRQDTVNYRLRPGEYQPVETGSKPLRDVVLPMPSRPIDGAFMQLVQDFVSTGQKLGGAAEIGVGEGKQDAPVGTTIALIEQAQKIMDAVHKRLCQAQGRELELLVDLFREDPEAFWRGNGKPATQWDRDTLVYCLETFGLQPTADPNTSSHMQRIMAAQGMLDLAKAAPMFFDSVEVIKHYLKMLRVPNAQRFIAPNAPPAGWSPPPKGAAGHAGAPPDPVAAQAKMATAQAAIAKAQAAAKDADTRATSAQSQAQIGAAKIATQHAQAQTSAQLDAARLHAETNDPSKMAQAQASALDARTNQVDAANRAHELQVDQQNNMLDAHNDAADRAAEDERERMRAAVELHRHGTALAIDVHKHQTQLEQDDRHHKAGIAEAAKDRKAQKSKPGGLGGAK